ncbi:hypothetical protein SCHPADRAFT_1002099 [Schizopora paradoxa]|uniref:BTB domain-containing protein n=1 Tax=Schizopora paradoxa TaxID=27342 RepID=A0A0H2R638_9AGAM|nr:hypothetical protein SCHPADRAFT_1002099 [Schizopora paradoxa]
MNVDADDTTPSSEPSNASPERHDILWFPDGNVVLQTDTYLFRVHKSVLSLHSSVFKDMFELPTVEDGASDEIMADDTAGMKALEETYEGVPLVALVGDKGEDVAHLLRTVYDHGYYISRSDDHPLCKITAILVLSTKYAFESIRTDVIGHLLKHYPMTLSEFDMVDDDQATVFQDLRCFQHFKLLKAALVADADVLLPGLFYVCSDFDLGHIAQSLRETLDKESTWRLLKGRDHLSLAFKRIQWIYLSESEACVKLHAPNQPTFDQFRLKDPEATAVFDTLTLKDVSGDKLVSTWPHRVCTNCGERLEKLINEEREKIWEELPSYFALPDWDILRAALE